MKNKIFTGAGIVLVMTMIFILVDQKKEIEEPYSASNHDTSLQQESKEIKKDENPEKDTESESSDDPEPLEKDLNNGNTTPIDEVSKTEPLPKENASEGQITTSPIEDARTIDPSTETSTGLHFSSREEAIAFGFSRFTPEEIAIYNRAAEIGLTPEQEAMAIQMAYSRFSQEEIAALEEALGR